VVTTTMRSPPCYPAMPVVIDDDVRVVPRQNVARVVSQLACRSPRFPRRSARTQALAQSAADESASSSQVVNYGCCRGGVEDSYDHFAASFSNKIFDPYKYLHSHVQTNSGGIVVARNRVSRSYLHAPKSLRWIFQWKLIMSLILIVILL
jgi:hypothetical protein